MGRFLRDRAKRLANLDATHTDQDYDLKELDLARTRRFNELLIPNKVPPEIRNQIAGYLCAPILFYNRRYFDGLRAHWFPAHIHKLPVSIFLEGIANWYRSKKIIIELPDFTPSSLADREPRWPSAIHIHDAAHEFSFWCAPPFMSRDMTTSSSARYLDLDDFEACPFWLFSSITIRIPPPPPDQASLIMNWNRLRYIGHALHSSLSRPAEKKREKDFHYLRFLRNPLPDIRIQFLEQASRSWLDSQGELRVSLDTVGHFIDDGSDEQPPDLVFLLRALAPVRGARSMRIDTPFNMPLSEQGRNFSVKWFENKQAQKYPFGEYMELGGWNDRESFEWLQRCELVLHMTLHSLDSKLAPYLRLEQMAHLDRLAIFRLFNHASRYGDHVQIAFCKQIKAIILHRCMHRPRKLCPCSVCSLVIDTWKWNFNSQDVLRRWNIPGAQIRKRDIEGPWKRFWVKLKHDWEQEFQAVHDRLQIASTAGKIKTLDEIEGFQRLLVNDCTYSWAELFFNHTNAPWDWRLVPDTIHWRDKYSIQAWLEEWPEGIANEVSATQAEKARRCEWVRRALEVLSE